MSVAGSRRSARLGSAGPAAPSTGVGRPTSISDLPGVAKKTNRAYGTSGRTNMPANAAASSGFHQAFDDSSQPSSRPSSRPVSRPATPTRPGGDNNTHRNHQRARVVHYDNIPLATTPAANDNTFRLTVFNTIMILLAVVIGCLLFAPTIGGVDSITAKAQNSIKAKSINILCNTGASSSLSDPKTSASSPHVLDDRTRTYLSNQVDDFYNVNWFALGNGAVVDPITTSKDTIYNGGNIYPPAYPAAEVNLPSIVLEPWREAGDCWCGLLGTQFFGNTIPPGWAQIGVHTPGKVFPRAVIVEHTPDVATIDKSATPQDMELWVHIQDSGPNQELWRHVVKKNGGRLSDRGPEYPKEWLDFPNDTDGKPTGPKIAAQAHKELNSQGLGTEWVRLGAWKYSSSESNYRQRFGLDADIQGLVPEGVNRAVVRAAPTEAGSPYVCLYRILLAADPARG